MEQDIQTILKELDLLKFYKGHYSLTDIPGKISKELFNYHKKKAEKLEALIAAGKPLPAKFDPANTLMY